MMRALQSLICPRNRPGSCAQGTTEEKEIGAKLIEIEKGRGFMSEGAVKVLNRKLKKVDAGEHDVYI